MPSAVRPRSILSLNHGCPPQTAGAMYRNVFGRTRSIRRPLTAGMPRANGGSFNKYEVNNGSKIVLTERRLWPQPNNKTCDTEKT
jgi:hypothetical protein